LLHGVGGEAWFDHVAGGVDPWCGGPVVAVDDDPAARVQANAGLFEAEAFGVGRTPSGEQNGVPSRTVPVESVTLSRPSTRLTPSAPTPRTSRIPRRLNSLATSPASSPSMFGSRRLELLMSVAGMPKAVNTVANSTLIGPPPKMTMSFGTVRSE
jgi:hypothetical protein